MTDANGVNRRAFVRHLSIGALGATLWPFAGCHRAETPPRDPTTSRRTSQPQTVVVLGAGLAGLAAALRLQRAGHDVTRPRTGGRVQTLREPFGPREGGEEPGERLIFDGVPARPVGPLSFQRDDGVLLSFLADDHGVVTHMVVRQAVYEKL